MRVNGLGPVSEAEVELRPLTIFAGASNTGKSYLSTMIYAVHSLGQGFSRFIAKKFMSGVNKEVPHKSDFRNLKTVIKWMKEAVQASGDDQGICSIKIPEKISFIFEKEIGENAALSEFLYYEMIDFIDPDNYYSRGKKASANFCISSLLNKNGRSLNMTYKNGNNKHKTELSGSVICLTRRERKLAIRIIEFLESKLAVLSSKIPKDIKRSQDEALSEIEALFPEIVTIYYSNIFKGLLTKTEFLPASRAALMVHKHIYSGEGLLSLARPERNQRLAVDPMSARYLSIIGDPYRSLKSSKEMVQLSQKIEIEILGGEVVIQKDVAGSFSYWFKQNGAKGRLLPLSKASSLVSDLAPLVIYIRNILNAGDTLIIEEPESHLHPRMQKKIADCIALLVKSGVNIIMTTHSEWIAERISYLVRLSDLKEHGKKFGGYECTLDQGSVGIWEFRHVAGDGSTVKMADFEHGRYQLDYSALGVDTFNEYDMLETRVVEIEEGLL